MESKVKTIGVLTSGGDAPGMNAAIRAAVRTALLAGVKVKGIRRGYMGLLEEDIFDMKSKSVSDIIQRGGTILYTARCPEFVLPEYQDKAAEICRKHEIDGLVVIGGDGSFRGAAALAKRGINTVGVPGTIDLDISCTDYTIGFDTAVNTAVETIDRVRDTSTSHERCSIIEVMGRHAGHIALWCGIANGAEEILIAERYDFDEVKIIKRINRRRETGKKHYIIINAEGIGESESMAKRIEATTEWNQKTIIGHAQREELLQQGSCLWLCYGCQGRGFTALGASNRVVAYKDSQFVDYDIEEALAMTKDIDQYMYELAKRLSQ